MAKQYTSAGIQCPYYKYETFGRTIHCAGVVDEDGATLNYIPHRGLFRAWKQRYCKDRVKCKRCYIHKAIAEREDNDDKG